MSLPQVRKETATAKAELMQRDHETALEYVNDAFPAIADANPVLAQAAREMTAMVAGAWHEVGSDDLTPELILESPATVPMMVLTCYLVDLLQTTQEIEDMEGGEV